MTNKGENDADVKVRMGRTRAAFLQTSITKVLPKLVINIKIRIF